MTASSAYACPTGGVHEQYAREPAHPGPSERRRVLLMQVFRKLRRRSWLAAGGCLAAVSAGLLAPGGGPPARGQTGEATPGGGGGYLYRELFKMGDERASPRAGAAGGP